MIWALFFCFQFYHFGDSSRKMWKDHRIFMLNRCQNLIRKKTRKKAFFAIFCLAFLLFLSMRKFRAPNRNNKKRREIKATNSQLMFFANKMGSICIMWILAKKIKFMYRRYIVKIALYKWKQNLLHLILLLSAFLFVCMDNVHWTFNFSSTLKWRESNANFNKTIWTLKQPIFPFSQ